MEHVMLENNAPDKIDGEEPTLFHILRMHNRLEARTVQQVQNTLGNTIDTPKDIIHTFVTHPRKNTDP